MRKPLSFRDFDWLLLAVALGIASIGILEIYSATAHTALDSQYRKQIYWVLLGLFAALVTAEPDLGTALTYLPIAAAGIFLAGIRGRQVAVLALIGLLALPAGWHFLKPYQRERVMTFAHPAEDAQGSGYQGLQAKIAIGSGGFWGKGIRNGTQSRLGFIPVSQADFVFAPFAEEQGFVGTLVVLLLYSLLLLRLLEGAQTASDR